MRAALAAVVGIAAVAAVAYWRSAVVGELRRIRRALERGRRADELPDDEGDDGA